MSYNLMFHPPPARRCNGVPALGLSARKVLICRRDGGRMAPVSAKRNSLAPKASIGVPREIGVRFGDGHSKV